MGEKESEGGKEEDRRKEEVKGGERRMPVNSIDICFLDVLATHFSSNCKYQTFV